MNDKLGHWAFLIGVLLAVLAGFVPALQTSRIVWVLVILGLLVGFLNITAKETQEFLIAAVALVISSGIAVSVIILPSWLTIILSNIVSFVFPAAFVVALKTVWSLASS